jgi:predicted nucleic acid-binding protein
VYLWDANIVRHFAQGHATLRLHLLRVSWSDIALPSVVVAEILRGRCDAVLKASPEDAPLAHRRLLETLQMLARFHVIAFDQSCAEVIARLRRQHRRRKRYADLMIAAMAIAGRHILVTRNQADFGDLLPPAQLVNWIDDPPG